MKRREPAPKGLSPLLQESNGGSLKWELGPLPRESLQGHPQVSLTPQVVERILVGVPPGTQHEDPLCLSLLVYSLPS